MAKRTFTKEYLLDELEILDNKELVISNRITSTDRWNVNHEIIFRTPDCPEGIAYMSDYTVGATELQCESPWEYENTVEATEVRQVEVVVKKWVPVK